MLSVVTAELKHRFQQERDMPIATLLEKILLDVAKRSFSVYPDELQIYDNDVKIDHLIAQLKMLSDLVRTYNEQNPATHIKEITKLSALIYVRSSMMFAAVKAYLVKFPPCYCTFIYRIAGNIDVEF